MLQLDDPEYLQRVRAVVGNSTDFSKIGDKPIAGSARKPNDALGDTKEQLFVLQSRPQRYESLSLTNSTEFGQHSVGSSIEVNSIKPPMVQNEATTSYMVTNVAKEAGDAHLAR